MTAKITDLIRTIQIFLAAEMQILLFISHINANSHIQPEMLFAVGLLLKTGHRRLWTGPSGGLKRKSTKITGKRTLKWGKKIKRRLKIITGNRK